jgi:hypothetical protein
MDLAANLEAAAPRSTRRHAVYGVSAEEARPRLDAYLNDPRRARSWEIAISFC